MSQHAAQRVCPAYRLPSLLFEVPDADPSLAVIIAIVIPVTVERKRAPRPVARAGRRRVVVGCVVGCADPDLDPGPAGRRG